MKVAGAREFLTKREIDEYEQEKEIARLQADFGLQIKKLELENTRLETKWTQLYRLPLAIILLPIKLVLAFAVPISVITKKELPENFWSFMRG